MTIDGNLNFHSGLLDIKVAGLNDYDKLVVTGAADFFAGTINVEFINGFAPQAGDAFEFLVGDNINIDFNVVNFIIAGLASGFEFTTALNISGLRLQALNDGIPLAAVPLPGALVLFGTGLLGMLRIMRRPSKPRRYEILGFEGHYT